MHIFLQLGKEVTASLHNGLFKCGVDDEICRLRYLRALRNLASPESLSVLLNHALHGTRKTTVAAMKALVTIPKRAWNETVCL